MPQAPITFQIDAELLASVEQRCESDGVTLTEFLTFAVNNALDVETMERTTSSSSDALVSLTERLISVEASLNSLQVNGERLKRMNVRLGTELKQRSAEQPKTPSWGGVISSIFGVLRWKAAAG